jgi:calcineurin-like phosphoesterase family protein
MTYYISDTHFWHSGILKWRLEFNSLEEMNETLIHNWNYKVTKHDRVFILGDFSLGNKQQTIKILNRLQGEKLLIKGNHSSVIKYADVKQKFGFVKDYYCKDKIVMFHYPMLSWRGSCKGWVSLYGHTHSNYPPIRIPNAYNCCVEVNNYEPCTLEEIIENNERWWVDKYKKV